MTGGQDDKQLVPMLCIGTAVGGDLRSLYTTRGSLCHLVFPSSCHSIAYCAGSISTTSIKKFIHQFGGWW